MIMELCTRCQTKLAISPEGLCNICDENALKKRVILIGNNSHKDLAKILAAHRTGITIPKPKK